MESPSGMMYSWDKKSTYIRNPPFFNDFTEKVPDYVPTIQNARILAVFGDSVTTDHISPAGSISKNSPAAKYHISNSVKPEDFNSFGSRRGNHEVMMRGTFGNNRIMKSLKNGGFLMYVLFLSHEYIIPLGDSILFQRSLKPFILE